MRRSQAKSVLPMMQILESRQLFSALTSGGQDVKFAVGAMIADPVRNDVYIVDRSNSRVLAVDLNLGRTIGFGHLTTLGGAMSVSTDDKTLFVSQPGMDAIQSFHLPEIHNNAGWLYVGAPVLDLAAGLNNQLFAVITLPTGQASLAQLDADSGTVLRTFGSPASTIQLQLSADRTHLYARSTTLTEWNVSTASAPTLIRTIPDKQSTPEDFAVDEKYGRIYTSDANINGVGVRGITSGSYALWPSGRTNSVAEAVGIAPQYVYGGSSGTIRQYLRSNGQADRDYTFTGTLLPGAIAVTPTGTVVYATLSYDSVHGYKYHVGVIGKSSIAVDGVPDANFVYAALALTPGNPGRPISFDAEISNEATIFASDTITSYTWDFGDGTTGTGQRTTHTYAKIGTYHAKLIATTQSGLSDDYSADVYAGTTPPVTPSAATISGVVFSDDDVDETKDLNEAVLSARRVYIDSNNNGKFDSGERSVLTNAGGVYRFTNLPAGVYRVRRDVPTGYKSTIPASGSYALELSGQQITAGFNFGAAPISARPTIRLNVGGTQGHDAIGQLWQTDQDFTGGTTSNSYFNLINSSETNLYTTRRVGSSFSYAVPVPKGAYRVRLLFADPDSTESGERVFTVSAEGHEILHNLDLFKTAGKATAYSFSTNVTVTDGILNLSFKASIGTAILCGIELTPV